MPCKVSENSAEMIFWKWVSYVLLANQLRERCAIVSRPESDHHSQLRGTSAPVPEDCLMFAYDEDVAPTRIPSDDLPLEMFVGTIFD